MAIDVEALLVPVSDDAPAGPDLSYDAERQDIENAFESSVSDDSETGGDTDWRKILGLITDQAGKTRDVWLGIYLMRAGAKAGRLDDVESGAELLAGLLERFWDSVHPQLDEYGYQGRKGPTESLTRLGEFINPLRKVALVEHPRLGSYGGGDFDRFAGAGDAEDGYGMFRAALEEVGDENLGEVVERLDRLSAFIKRIDNVLTDNADGDTGTNFAPTYEAIAQMRKGVVAFMKTAPDGGGEGDSSENWNENDTGGGESTGGGGSGRVETRDDVLRSLDAIASYYARREPGSPVPVILRRARDWVGMDFMAVLEDIAPNSLDEAKKVLVRSSGGDSGGWSDS